MRLVGFGLMGVAAALALGCGSAGSGTGGPFGGGTVPGTGDQPPNSTDMPTNTNTAPSNPNQPPNGSSVPASGVLCESACDLAVKYPCILSMDCSATVGSDAGVPTTNCTTVTKEECLNACEAGLTSASPQDLACGMAGIELLKCADQYGDASCPAHGGNPTFSSTIALDCGSQLQAQNQACNGTSQGCGPADSCDGCVCQHPNDLQACADVCGQPNNGTCTLAGDQCAGCPDQCSMCTCFANGDPTNCTSCTG